MGNACTTPDLEAEDYSACAEQAAVNSMFITVIGWLIVRSLAPGEMGNAREKLVISLIIVAVIVSQVYYTRDPVKKGPGAALV